MLIGIDEVGRGSWAGPLLVVAAKSVATLPIVLKDSKQLSKKQREKIALDLALCCEFGEGWVSNSEIDEVGLSSAMRLAVARALDSLSVFPEDEIIMDGTINYCPDKYLSVKCIIKADSLHPVVSAASIYAKVKRDSHMSKIASKYPGYGFEKHVGYGTKMHLEGLKRLGPCEIHRLSYKPVAAYA